MTDAELMEKLAAIEHTRWADWQRYLHSKCVINHDGSATIPVGYKLALDRQIHTPYEELTEEEKEHDRREVRRYWDLVKR